MLREFKKIVDLEKHFQENPMAIIDFAYEAIINNLTLTTEEKDVFNRNTKLLEKIPVGEMVKKAEMFLELDVFSSNFKVLENMKVWQVIQYYGEEAVKMARFQ